MRITDRRAILIALRIATDSENALIDAYRDQFSNAVDENEEGVRIARQNIAAFKRVRERYFPNSVQADPLKGAKLVNIFDLLKGKIPDGE